MSRSVRCFTRPLAAAAVAAVWMTLSPSVKAETSADFSARFGDTHAPEISDQKLDAAASAVKLLSDVRDAYQQRIDAAAPSDRERIADERISAMIRAVTDQGLSVQEYSSIIEVAQSDPEVREKIARRVRSSE
jgi:hypothetical protein